MSGIPFSSISGPHNGTEDLSPGHSWQRYIHFYVCRRIPLPLSGCASGEPGKQRRLQNVAYLKSLNRLEKLFKPQQPFDKIQIGRRYLAFLAHQALALLGFLGKNMTFERFLVGDLAG